MTTPGAPFPPTAVLSEVGPQVSLAVFDSPGPGVLIGFPIRVSGDGISSADDTGILATGAGGTSVLLREGDPSCAPAWTGGGTVYDEFVDTQLLSMSVLDGPSVLLEARSRGGTAGFAIVRNTGSCSGSTLVLATSGGAAPGGGTFSLPYGPSPLEMNASGDAGFSARTTTPDDLRPRPSIVRSSTGLVTREQLANTSLGPTAKVTSTGKDLGMNGASELVFSAAVYPTRTGLFFAAGSGAAPELLNFGGTNPQIDDFGNMTALF